MSVWQPGEDLNALEESQRPTVPGVDLGDEDIGSRPWGADEAATGRVSMSWQWFAAETVAFFNSDIQQSGVVLRSMQAAVEGTLGLGGSADPLRFLRRQPGVRRGRIQSTLRWSGTPWR